MVRFASRQIQLRNVILVNVHLRQNSAFCFLLPERKMSELDCSQVSLGTTLDWRLHKALVDLHDRHLLTECLGNMQNANQELEKH